MPLSKVLPPFCFESIQGGYKEPEPSFRQTGAIEMIAAVLPESMQGAVEGFGFF
jgi:hypothetical protein